MMELNVDADAFNSRKAQKQHYDITVYLDRLGLALSTVPNQHIELYQLLSA